MSVYESSITNPKKQLEFYKILSEQLQKENKQLKELEKEHQKINGELREENKILKEQRNKMACLVNDLQEVIDKINKKLKLERKTALSLKQSYTVSVIDSVLQILDK